MKFNKSDNFKFKQLKIRWPEIFRFYLQSRKSDQNRDSWIFRSNKSKVYMIHDNQIEVMSQLQHSISIPLLQLMKQKSDQQTISVIKKTSKLQQEVKVLIAVWNLQGVIPPTNSIKTLMDELQSQKQNADIICISTQQCQRSITLSFFCENKDEWENSLKQCAKGYKMVEGKTMRALHTAIFVKQDIANCYTTQKFTLMRAGTCNLLGNKGAINIVANLLGQNFQFINCHLEAHQDQCDRRNQILLKIVDEMVQKDYRNEVFICGDLNYRIDMTHQEYYAYVKDKKNNDSTLQYSKMFSRDQLSKQQILKQKFFPFFKQAAIKFPPTYKINANSQQYDKKRIPGWTDRVFNRKGRSKQLGYRCLYELLGTDHRPVIAGYTVETQQTLSIFPDEYVSVTSKSCALI